MKNKFLFSVITVFVLFMSCKEDEVQKIIEVTGLTSFAGKYAVTGLGSTATGVSVALSNPALISSGGTARTYLLDASDGISGWTGSGSFIVVLLIVNQSASATYWSGAIVHAVSVTEETTTLPFSSFTYVASANNVNIAGSLKNILNSVKE